MNCVIKKIYKINNYIKELNDTMIAEMNKQTTIEEINKFLKGIHMGGTTFKDYLDKAKDPELKNNLIKIIESFKRHEEAITHRIEMLGGNPADNLGVMGTMSSFIEKIKLIPVESDFQVCQHAVQAIRMGMEQGNKFIAEHKDLEPSISKEVQGVVKDYDDHLRSMEQIMTKYKNK